MPLQFTDLVIGRHPDGRDARGRSHLDDLERKGYDGQFHDWSRSIRMIAFSKLQRNSDRDMEDVKLLALTVPLNVNVLEQRYQDDHRPYLTGRVEREDVTLRLWIEMIKEEHQASRPQSGRPQGD